MYLHHTCTCMHMYTQLSHTYVYKTLDSAYERNMMFVFLHLPVPLNIIIFGGIPSPVNVIASFFSMAAKNSTVYVPDFIQYSYVDEYLAGCVSPLL